MIGRWARIPYRRLFPIWQYDPRYFDPPWWLNRYGYWEFDLFAAEYLRGRA